MTGSQGQDDGAQVDVEAAWAQIVLHWDDDLLGRADGSGLAADPQPRLVTEPVDGPHQPGGSPRPGGGAGQPGGAGGLGGAGTSSAAGPDAPGQPHGPGQRIEPTRPVPPDHASLTPPPGTPITPVTPVTPVTPATPGWDGRDERGAFLGEPPAPEVDEQAGSTQWRVGGRGAEDDRWGAGDVLDDEGFVPPEPPPLPRGNAVSWLAWGGVLGAPLFLLLAAVFWTTAPSLLVAAAVVAFVAGFGTLVVRMPDRRPDDGDDGAVV